MYGDSARAYLPIVDRNMVDHQIEFQPIGRRGSCPDGETLLVGAYRLGVELVSICSGIEKCKGCKIRVMEETDAYHRRTDQYKP
jgi:uncharacterized 2Fe-2S/4Fe-4S cluster protein (DUF4445 family)